MRSRPGPISGRNTRNCRMKRLKGFLVPVLILAMLLALPALASEPTYVGRVGLETMPESWDPLGEKTPEATSLLALTAEPLYRVSDDGRMLPAQAAELPADVTAEYAGRYGVPQDAVRGYAFEIRIREGACWEGGKKVTPADWEFTMRKLLESGCFPLEIANYRAFLRGDTVPSDQIISLKEAGFSSVSEAEEGGYSDFYLDITHFWGLDAGWLRVTDRTPLIDAAIPSGCEEMYLTAAYLYRTYLSDGGSQQMFQSEFVGIPLSDGEKLTMEDVGLIAEESRLVLISQEPAAAGYVAAVLADLTPVRSDAYDGTYGTEGNYSACGPYRITSVTADEITLEPNPHWTGAAEKFKIIRCSTGG